MVQERRHADPIPQWLTWFRAIRTLAPLGVVLVMFTALAAILLRVPEPAKTVAEWALPLSAVELGVSSITVQIRDIRMDPDKRRRVERIWHTAGARIFVCGFIAFAVGLCIAGAGVTLSVWTQSLAALSLLGTPATIIMGLGVVALVAGLVTYLIEDAVRDSRWPEE